MIIYIQLWSLRINIEKEQIIINNKKKLIHVGDEF